MWAPTFRCQDHGGLARCLCSREHRCLVCRTVLKRHIGSELEPSALCLLIVGFIDHGWCLLLVVIFIIFVIVSVLFDEGVEIVIKVVIIIVIKIEVIIVVIVVIHIHIYIYISCDFDKRVGVRISCF